MNTPFIEIDESLGTLYATSMPSQDVYLLTLIPDLQPVPFQVLDECYAIPKDYSGNVISKRALSYGIEHNSLLIFDSDHGKYIIDYELMVEQMKLTSGEEKAYFYSKLLELSVFGREMCPQYFGEFIPPADTPRGPTTRYHHASNGIFFVEGGKEWLLAVCYPIWQSELSIHVHNMGERTLNDEKYDIDKTYGYLFFSQAKCAPAFLNLCKIKKATTWRNSLFRKNYCLQRCGNRHLTM